MRKVETLAVQKVMLEDPKTVPTFERRPTTRGECVDGERPCPWVGCRHHLALSVHPGSGSIWHAWDVDNLDAMPETCSLDVADEGENDEARVALLMNLDEDAEKYYERTGLVKLRRRMRGFR